MDLIMIKFGGSVITDINKEGIAKKDEIERIFREIKPLIKTKKIIIGHGSGSFAHVPAHKYKVNHGIINNESVFGACVTQDAAAKLNRIVIECALKIHLDAFSFAPSSAALSKDGIIEKWDIAPMIKALELGFLPITYGDVIIDNSKGVSIGSTEEVFRYVSKSVRPKKIIIGTDVDGIFDSDPKINHNAKLIKEVNKKNIDEIIGYAGGSTKVDVTGGMKTKIQYLYNISKETGALCQIINLSLENRLKSAINNEKVIGTIIDANNF